MIGSISKFAEVAGVTYKGKVVEGTTALRPKHAHLMKEVIMLFPPPLRSMIEESVHSLFCNGCLCICFNI